MSRPAAMLRSPVGLRWGSMGMVMGHFLDSLCVRPCSGLGQGLAYGYSAPTSRWGVALAARVPSIADSPQSDPYTVIRVPCSLSGLPLRLAPCAVTHLPLPFC